MVEACGGGIADGHVAVSGDMPQLSLDTLLLCRQLLNAQQLQVGDPAFVETVQAVLVAIEELDRAISTIERGGTG